MSHHFAFDGVVLNPDEDGFCVCAACMGYGGGSGGTTGDPTGGIGAPGNALVAGIAGTTRYTGADTLLSFSFATTAAHLTQFRAESIHGAFIGGTYRTLDGSTTGETELIADIRAAMTAISRIANLGFTENTDFGDDNVDLKFMAFDGLLYDDNGINTPGGNITTLNGIGTFPGDDTLASADNFESYTIFGSSSASMTTDPELGGSSNRAHVAIHEILHSIGLGHPHDGGNGSGSWTTDSNSGAGENVLDNNRYTVMSYERSGLDVNNQTSDFGYAVTPMALDIAALHHLYGSRANYTGNTTYRLTDPETFALDTNGNDGFVSIGRAFYAIWDTGGTDRINYDGSRQVLINLNAATMNQAADPAHIAEITSILNGSARFAALLPLATATELRNDLLSPQWHAGGFGSRIFNAAGVPDLGGYYIASDIYATGAHTTVIEIADGSNLGDILIGNTAANTLYGRGGDDLLLGSDGNDTIWGESGNDEMHGGSGFDVLDGGSGNDSMNGGTFGDTLRGGTGNDTLNGGDGFDLLEGGGDNDSMLGGTGNDTLTGGSGNDTMRGGDNDDTFRYEFGVGAGPGESVNGDAGFDRILMVSAAALSTFNFTGFDVTSIEEIEFGADGVDVDKTAIFDSQEFDSPGEFSPTLRIDGNNANGSTERIVINMNTVGLDIAGWTFQDWGLQGERIEIVGTVGANSIASTSQADVVRAGGGNDTVTAGGGADFVDGEAGNDSVFGGDGNDTLEGGSDNDTLFGEAGADSILGEDGNDSLLGGADNDTLNGGAGNDRLDGGNFLSEVGSGDDRLIGGAGNDNVDGDDGNDVLFGANNFWGDSIVDADTLIGDGGNDSLYGSDGGDSLQGGTGNDLLMGNGGNDVLDGGEGEDTASYLYATTTVVASLATGIGTGGDGVDDLISIEHIIGSNAFGDSLTGSSGANRILGLGGDDTLLDGDGADTLDGGNGNDRIVATEASFASVDFYEGGVGIDTFDTSVFSYIFAGFTVDLSAGVWTFNALTQFVTGFENINGANGVGETLRGNALANVINANGGNDAVEGEDGNDTLDGGSGLDTVRGGAGDDVIRHLNAGLDTYDGGTGIDTLVNTISLAKGVEIDLLAGTYTFGAATASWTGFENYDGSSTPGDSSEAVFGTEGANRIATGAGANLLLGRGDSDTLLGGAGNDTLDGGLGSDSIDAGPGDDLVLETTGAIGTDSNDGGEGNDTIDWSALTLSGATFDLGGGTAATASFVEVMAGFENLIGSQGGDSILGSGVDNRLDGQAGDDTIGGGAGNDTIDGGAGADLMFGNDGDDLFRVDDAGDRVTENAGQGIDTVESTISFSLRSAAATQHVEHLTLLGGADIAGDGNGQANILTGNVGNNLLTGAWGNDTLIGGTGDDTLDGEIGADSMVGGLGDDIFRVDNAGDVVRENAGEGTDLVESSISFSLRSAAGSLNVENLTLTGAANIDGDGNGLANTITGNGGNNLLNGAFGNDTLIGGAGNDTFRDDAGADHMIGGTGDDLYRYDNAGDTITELAGEGTDTVETAIDLELWAVSQEVETVVLLGSADLNVTANALDNLMLGNAGDDTLGGGAGNDTIDGGAGADEMYGSFGDDVFIVDDVGDRVFEFAGRGTDRVESSVSFSLRVPLQDIENLTLTGGADIDGDGNGLANVIIGNDGNNLLTGAWGNDTLIGGAGNDTLSGDAGADSMVGGTGDDLYRVDNAGDTIAELAGGGTDTVETGIDLALWALSQEVENVVLTGGGDLTVSGNASDNGITGNDGANQISGGAGDDTIDGGAGADTLFGGPGADTFLFADPGAADIVGDFALGDLIALSAAAFFGLPLGPLAPGAFALGATAAEDDDRLIYDSLTGVLRFDEDGSGGLASVHLASFTGAPALDGTLFTVV